MMKTLKNLIVLAALLAFPALYANEVGVLIVSKDVKITNITKSELENIFLGRQTLWENGKRINIALSSENSNLLENFLLDNVGQDKRRFQKYWLKKVFAGYGIAPKIFKEDDKAREYTKQQESTIAFITVTESAVPKDFNIVTVEGRNYFE